MARESCGRWWRASAHCSVRLRGIFDGADELFPHLTLRAARDAGHDGVRPPGLAAQMLGELLVQRRSDRIDRRAAAAVRPAILAGGQIGADQAADDPTDSSSNCRSVGRSARFGRGRRASCFFARVERRTQRVESRDFGRVERQRRRQLHRAGNPRILSAMRLDEARRVRRRETPAVNDDLAILVLQRLAQIPLQHLRFREQFLAPLS